MRLSPSAWVGALAVGALLAACGEDDRVDGTQRGSQPGESRSAETPGGWLAGEEASTADIRGPELIRQLYVGLSCPTPNSFECDRVSVAVQLQEPAAEVRLSIAGRPVDMGRSEAGGESGSYWVGHLQPAGLVDGPLRALAESGSFRWVSEPPVAAAVEIEVDSSSHWTTLGAPQGATFSATFSNVPLHAGYG